MSTLSTSPDHYLREVEMPRKVRSLWQVVQLIVRYVTLIVIAIGMLTPLLWMISSALKPRSQIFMFPPMLLPDPVMWSNFVDAWNAVPFDLYVFNSFKVAILAVVGQLFFCSLAGYGFARFSFPFKNLLFGMLLAVMMIPAIVNIVPLFILYKNIGWLDNHAALIVPSAVANTFGTFLFRQFMMTIPQELEDAARIDGANAFGIYWRIMLPLTASAAAVLATFTFIGSWNSFFGPLVFLQSQENFTVPIGLAFFRTEEGTEWHLLMAASVITMLPTIVVFFFTQKYFIQGITLGSVKA